MITISPAGLVHVPFAVNSWKLTEFAEAQAIPFPALLSAVNTNVFAPIANPEGLPEPSPAIMVPFVERSTADIAEVPFPIRIPFAVKVVAPDPPLATGKVPLTPVANATCAHAGLLDVPVLVKTLVEFVSLASRWGVFAALAINKSP